VKPARFAYEAPTTLEGVLKSLAKAGDGAKVIAGGQSLAPMLNMRLARPDRLIDINAVGELGEIAIEGDWLNIGALVRHETLARNELVKRHCPLLARAAETIGHYAIRKRGTIGGSLAHADPAAQLPLVALALDAEMDIRSTRGPRVVGARDFFVSIFSTVIDPHELLVKVKVPLSLAGEHFGFRLFNRRAGDFAIVSVAAALIRRSDDKIARLRLAIGGIGPVPVRVEHLAVSEASEGFSDRWSARVAAAVAKAVEIEENERAPVVFRRELVSALTREALDAALERAGRGGHERT
jgi:aerobic carbon-monoxide dehydrogenase medium subunit